MIRRAALLLVSGYLLLWIPLTFAAELLSTLPSIGMRGVAAVVELSIHAVAAVVCATGGWMIAVRAPAAYPVAAAGIAASGVLGVQSVLWSVLPRDVAPGSAVPLAALTCAATLLWLTIVGVAWRRGW